MTDLYCRRWESSSRRRWSRNSWPSNRGRNQSRPSNPAMECLPAQPEPLNAGKKFGSASDKKYALTGESINHNIASSQDYNVKITLSEAIPLKYRWDRERLLPLLRNLVEIASRWQLRGNMSPNYHTLKRLTAMKHKHSKFKELTLLNGFDVHLDESLRSVVGEPIIEFPIAKINRHPENITS